MDVMRKELYIYVYIHISFVNVSDEEINNLSKSLMGDLLDIFEGKVKVSLALCYVVTSQVFMS